ncbi:hypothetical protein WAE58_22125 [Pedobacter panaciterrae]|uniref:Uncharacterized protein n=1 Tax=Pedobacter panaciterrae TaxID=363849 RepID=A0ABU8NSA4_9SPHI
MRYILFSLFILLTTTFVQAQTFTIDAKGKPLPAVDGTKFKSITFIVDKAFKNKTFEIYLEDGTTIANKDESVLDKDLSRNLDDLNYTVKIEEDHKVIGCNKCLSITDKFTVKLNGKSLGTFSLTPINPDIDKPIVQQEIYRPGSIINDALFIAAAKETESKASTIKKILATQYKINSSNELDANLYLKDEIRYVFLGTPQGGLSLKGLASSVGGLDVTNIADGFAKFIVKRTKEELSIAFFQQFKNELDTYKDLKTVFPKTHGLLTVIDKEIYTYSNYINNLREAFRADIKLLDENLPGIVDNNKAFFNLDKNYIYRISLLSGCYLSRSLKHDMHPGDILQGFPLNYFYGAPAADQSKINVLKGSIQTLQLLSESLKESDTSKGRYWVDAAKLRELADKPLALKIYMGLLVETAKIKYNNIPYSNSANLYALLNDRTLVDNFSTHYPKYKQFIVSVGAKTNELNKMIKEFDATAPDSVKVEKYAKYFRATVELFQSATEISDLPAISAVTDMVSLKADSEPYFNVAYQVTDLVSAINRKRYPEAVNNLVLIYNSIYVWPALAQIPNNPKELTKKEKIAIADDLIAAAKADGTPDIGPIVNKDANVAATIQNNSPTLRYVNHIVAAMAKYGAFMANMIEAKNSEEVAEAIESVALPVGSASIKRKSSFNVSLNAYCGLFLGNEIIKGLDDHHPLEKVNSFGLAAPIGITLSRGNSFFPWPFCFFDKGNSGCSSSLFVSLVDLGAVAAFRFEDSKTEQVPSIQLKDILSPGIFWSLGLPKAPISINFGVQMGPNLRKVTVVNNEYSGNTYTRYSMSICVDIPLLNLYTKSKN